MSLSPRLERDIAHTLWLVRLLVYTVLALIGASALAAVIALAVQLITGDDSVAGIGNNVHAPLTRGGTATARTEGGRVVEADIVSVTWEQGPVVTARVTGVHPVEAARRWFLYLEGDTRLPMQGIVQADGTIRAALEGSLPAGSRVRFVHFDPDDSRGDIYLDVKQ